MDNKGIMECIELMCDALPKLRNALNLTQKDFSKVIGVSRQSIINMEHKEKNLFPVGKNLIFMREGE